VNEFIHRVTRWR